MHRFLIVSAGLTAALIATATYATAQEFKGSCTELKTNATCIAADACRWINRKPVTVNGQVLDPSSCAFKPGVKAALKAAATK